MNDFWPSGSVQDGRSGPAVAGDPPESPSVTSLDHPRKLPRAAEATIRIRVARESIFAFEEFIDLLPFPSPSERARLKLAGSEIFDNLVRHSSPVEGGSATIRAAMRGNQLYLIFAFKSPSFASYAARCFDYEPIFDHHARRWHGMGLRMTRNLSSSLVFRAGDFVDRVIIRL